jgi:zinc protease
VALPTEADVRAMMAEVEKAEVAAYAEEEVASSLMETLPAAGRVVSERQVPATGVTEWTLSNGARVVLKPTDFKQDEITVTAFSKGGHSLVSDADYLSASNATGIISQSGVGQFSMNEMRKVLAGKSASVSPSIGTMSEGLNGQSTVKDVETMFQLMHLYFTQPRKDEEAFQSFIAKNRAFMKNIMENPMTYFSIERSRIMNGRHPRAGVFPTDEQWDQISLEAAYRVYQERFANAGDFTFIFVGSFKVEDMKPLVEQYVASLPGQPGQAEMGKDLGIRPPAGAVSEVLRKGTDPKSMVAMTYMKDAPYKGEVSFALTALAEALSIKLIETLRESEGGVYTVRASASATREPYDQYSLTFQMPCGPENAEKLTQLAMEQVERMRKSGPTPEDLHKVKEQMKRELEENLRKNDYWQRQLRNRYYYGEGTDKPMGDLAMIEALSVKGLQKVAKKFIDPKRYVRVTLMPEQP